MDPTAHSIVGDLINFRGLVYSPLNENGVIFLFGKVAEDMNMYVEEIKPGFPDCIARRFVGKGWERVAVEFEYKSSNFRSHGHDPKFCDLIICWEHDWPDCPLEVIELRDRIKQLENRRIKRPDKRPDGSTDIEKWFERHKVKSNVQDVFRNMIQRLQEIDDSVFYNVGKTAISVYCPERVFAYYMPRQTKISLNLFTNGEPLHDVRQYEFAKGAQKWGNATFRSMSELDAVFPSLEQSLKRIKECIKHNEPTGWFAEAESDGDDEADEETACILSGEESEQK